MVEKIICVLKTCRDCGSFVVKLTVDCPYRANASCANPGALPPSTMVQPVGLPSGPVGESIIFRKIYPPA